MASFMISLPTIMALFHMAPDTMTNVMAEDALSKAVAQEREWYYIAETGCAK